MFEESIASLPSLWASINSWLTPSVLFLLLNLMIGTIAITSSLATHKPSNNNDPHSQEKLAHSQESAHQLGRSPSVVQRLESINFYHYRSQETTSLTFEKPQDFTSTTSHFSFHQETLQQDHYYQQQQLQAPPQQPPLPRSTPILQRLRSINFYNYLSPQPKAQQASQQEQAFYAHYNQENEQEKECEEEDEVQDPETVNEIYSKLKEINKVVDRSMSDTKPSAGEKPSKLSKKMKKSASSKSTFCHFEEEDIVESLRPAPVREGTKGKLAEMDDSEVDAKADDFINKFKEQLKLQRLDSIMSCKEMISRVSAK